MKSQDITMTFKKNPYDRTMRIIWYNKLFVLSNEDHGVYDCEAYEKLMNGDLKKDSTFSKAANVMCDSCGNVVSIIYYEDNRLISPTHIVKIIYNKDNTISEEILLDGKSLNVIMKYTYEYDELGRIIRGNKYRDTNTEPLYAITYAYIGDDDTVRYMDEYICSEPLSFSNKVWYDVDGHVVYRIETEMNEGVIYSHKYKYNKKKDGYKCKTTRIKFN